MSPSDPSNEPSTQSPRTPGWRRWRWPLLALFLVIAAMIGRATWEQVSAFDRAVAAEAAGLPDRAIAEYRWTLRWTTPLGPRDGDAADALLRIANESEAQRPERAAFALDALRSGLIASRSLWQPHADLVAQANQRLPALLLRVAERRGDTRDKAQLLTRLQADFARPVGVPGWLALLVALGFLAWLGGLAMAWARGFDGDGALQRAALPWLATALAGFAVWAGALWLA